MSYISSSYSDLRAMVKEALRCDGVQMSFKINIWKSIKECFDLFIALTIHAYNWKLQLFSLLLVSYSLVYLFLACGCCFLRSRIPDSYSFPEGGGNAPKSVFFF